ncbi:hypothetical protein [Wolbachia endosymbiont (group A) of Barypeithes pellucidus]|uniref:hypothetical protein n=1 Tax=Wolbachia endosymbiont (group A) of Barypeithes pellucidus TaxID=3139322 RepID=UPI003CCAAA4A
MAQTSKESVEKKFKDVFERSPGAFPEGTSLEEKVNYIAKGTEALKAVNSKELENKMKNVAELNQKFESQKGRADEKVRQDFERIAELDQQYKGKGIFTSEKVAELKNDKKFQEAANTLRETTTEGESVEQSGQKKTSETSVQTDTQPSRVEGLRNPEFQEAANTLRETTAKDKSIEQSGQKKTTEASVQTDTQPSKHDSQTVSPSVSKSSVKEKLNNKKPEQDKKDNMPQPQENQKEEGFLSLLKRFVKKMLEKLLGEDEKSVENTHNMREAAQKNTSNNEMQQKSMDQSSFININGKEFNLEPEKAFNYQDKALNINITYNSPETKQNLQQDTTSPNIANAVNLNINGKEYSVQPGESFNHKSPGLEISVVNGHQQSKNFDKILDQDRSISEGLKQATQLENPMITPIHTPKVNEVNTGRER